MKKTLSLLLSFLLLLSACTARSASPSLSEEENDEKETPSVPSVLEQPAELPSAAPENEGEKKEENSGEEEDSDEKEEEETADDELGNSASGVFRVLNSGYEITLKSPLSGIYDQMAGGFYISAQGDAAFQGLISYTSDAAEVKSIEDNITVLNDTLKADDSVKDFKFDRQKDADGLYSITFSYRNIGDEYSASGYNYVLYRQTDSGMITVMFTAQDSSYESTIQSAFQSVQPATAEAVDPPTR